MSGWVREDGKIVHGALFPVPETGTPEERAKAAHDLTEQLVTATGFAGHDGSHYVWPPTSQRENSAALHQFSLDLSRAPLFIGRCSCGWPEEERRFFNPPQAFAAWESHLMEEGVL